MNSDDIDADIERMLAIRHNRRELGWSYYRLETGGGQVRPHHARVADKRTAKCGTVDGYNAHLSHGTTPCRSCRLADDGVAFTI